MPSETKNVCAIVKNNEKNCFAAVKLWCTPYELAVCALFHYMSEIEENVGNSRKHAHSPDIKET